MDILLWRANAARFFSKVDVGSESDCWPWRAKISAHHRTGIFAFSVGGKKKPTAPHLVSWVLHNGPLLANKRVEARCKNIHCCNPDHLYIATKQGRVRRCSDKTLADLTEERFWENLDVKGPDDCWLWKGATSHFGYGIVTHQRAGKKVTEGAHRYIFYRQNPATDPTAFICHRCDVPACANPKHLYAGDALTNNRDREQRGRNGAGYGAPANAKLSADIVRDILEQHRQGKLNQTLVAKQYGVSQSAIYAIVKRLTWRHITL